MPSHDAHAVQARVWCPRCCLEELLGVLSRCKRCCRLLSSSCYQACCPSAKGVAGRAGCCPAAAVPCRCCRVLLMFRPWGELLSILSSAAECCCCPSAVQQLQVLQVLSKLLSMLSSRLGFGAREVLLDVICCWRGV
jgi:hypothetical protein